MAEQLEMAVRHARQARTTFLKRYKEILAVPSVSTDPERAADLQRAAEWVVERLQDLGMQRARLFSTTGHPVVYGEWLEAPGAPVVLVYGHYDVQPADPLDLWTTDPFDPVVRGEDLFARGASDMKGQLVAALAAVEALVRTGGMPVNIKWLIEGEEEIGSPSLEAFLTRRKDFLRCDLALNPDAGMIGPEDPTITYALRGLAYFELRVHGPEHDLHSGQYGGVVRNPAIALADLIAGLHDDQGRVTLPGFYDKVRKLSNEERADLARLPIDETHFLKQTGAPALYGEAGYTANERIGARPTLDVNGLLSGFTGQGSKTVIPAWAMAKISTRLVPDQDPKDVHQQLLSYLDRNAPADVRWELKQLAGGPASISARDNPGVQAMSRALESVWGKRPYFRREGGSIPVVAHMQRILGVESVVCGFGLPDDNIHAPNEKQHLPTWQRGIEALIRFFCYLKS